MREFGAAEVPMAGEAGHALRWGLLSTARINDKLLAGARTTDEAEVVAVASRDGERARAWADERGIARAHGSYEALLADPEVDAVYVSLPNALHVPWSRRALEAGKHVLCEKPLTRRPQEAAAAFDARRGARAPARRGVHVAPPSAGAAAADARRGGRDRHACATSAAVFSFPLSDHADVRHARQTSRAGR